MKHVFNRAALVLGSSLLMFGGAAMASDRPLTQDGQTLQQIEQSANAASPSKKIVVLDYDMHLLTLLRESELLRLSLKKQFADKGFAAPMEHVSSLRDAMGGSIESFHPAFMGDASMSFVDEKGVKVCAVVPATPDLSALTAAQSYFNLHAGVTMDISFSPRAQTLRGTYQGLWHCLDDKYQPQVEALFSGREKDPMGFSYARHKAEMFSEVAAGLELAIRGDTAIIGQQADLRALRSATAGPRFAKMFIKKMDPEYYDGALYYLTPALDALAAHVQEAGLEKVKTYTTEDIKRVASEITEKHALTRAQYVRLNDYHATKTYPANDAFMKGVIDRLAKAQEHTGVKSSSFTLPPPETGDYKTTYPDKYVEAQPEAQRKALEENFRTRIGKGATPETALVGMLDEIRAELHGADTRGKAEAAEKKITLLRGLAEVGTLREIAREKPPVPETSLSASAPSR